MTTTTLPTVVEFSDTCMVLEVTEAGAGTYCDAFAKDANDRWVPIVKFAPSLVVALERFNETIAREKVLADFTWHDASPLTS